MKKNIWSKKLNNLLAKKKESITKTIPKLSYPIILSIIVAFLLPITKLFSDLVECTWHKILLALSPLIIAILIWVVAAIKEKKYRNPSNLFYIYKERDLQQTVEETISEREPSVREFRNWMNELSADLKKETVIVFDNMDRLSQESVKILWSSIHTFFAESRYNKIWVIVPFDRLHIQEAFHDNLEKSNHFINKTFSVIFNVSPPVLTDWKKFFRKKFYQAFGDTENDEFDVVKNVFDLYEFSITPRKIIAFINDLVSLKLIWKDEIPLRYMALFVVNRQTLLSNPLEQILNKGYLQKSKFIFNSDEKVADYIASLVYNVKPDLASEVTLFREIEFSIRSKDVFRINELLKHPSFFAVLEKVISSEDIDTTSAILMLSKVDNESLDNQDKSVLQEIWNILVERRIGLNVESQELSEELQTLLKKTSSNKRRSLLKSITAEFVSVKDFKGGLYYNSLQKLEQYLIELDFQIDLKPLLVLKEVTPEIFIDYLKEAKANYKEYKVVCNSVSLDKYLTAKVPNELSDIKVITFISDKYELPKTIAKIEASISNNEVKLENLEYVFSIYKSFKKNVLPVKLVDNQINTLLQNAERDSFAYFELIAMRVAKGSKFPVFGGIADAILDIPNDELVNEVAHRISSYETYGNLLIELLVWNKPLLKEILIFQTNYNVAELEMNIVETLPKFDKIVNALKIEPRALVEKFSGWSIRDLISTKNLENIVPDTSFLNVALTLENEFAAHLQSIAIEYIDELNYEDWKTTFKNSQSYAFRLLIALLTSKKINSLSDEAKSAYKEILDEISHEKVVIPTNKDDWYVIYNTFNETEIQSKIKDVRDNLIYHGYTDKKMFLFFEDMLRENGDLINKSGDVIRRIVIPVLNNHEVYTLITNNEAFYLQLSKLSGTDSYSFLEKLRLIVENNSNEISLINFERKLNLILFPNVKVLKAYYYSTAESETRNLDVTEKIAEFISEGILHFQLTNTIFSTEDIHPNISKELTIEFIQNDNSVVKTFKENEWVKLP